MAAPTRTRPAPGSEAVGHSLWLLPAPEVRPALADLIRTLAGALGTPVFEPHVTLVGSTLRDRLSLVGATVHLASTLRPIDLRLRKVSTSARYFRALVLEAGRPRELMTARRRALGACEPSASAPYAPHLSLVYGTLTPARRRALANTVGGAFTVLDLRFTHVAVVWTQGPVGAWRRVATFPLESPVHVSPSRP